MEISASTPHLFRGTMLAGNTLTHEIDLSDAVAVGLIARTAMVLGTLTFMVSGLSDAESGVYVDLKDDSGTNVSVGPVSGTFGVSTLVTSAFLGYRYLRIKSSVAQTNGVSFVLPGRA